MRIPHRVSQTGEETEAQTAARHRGASPSRAARHFRAWDQAGAGVRGLCQPLAAQPSAIRPARPRLGLLFWIMMRIQSTLHQGFLGLLTEAPPRARLRSVPQVPRYLTRALTQRWGDWGPSRFRDGEQGAASAAPGCTAAQLIRVALTPVRCAAMTQTERQQHGLLLLLNSGKPLVSKERGHPSYPQDRGRGDGLAGASHEYGRASEAPQAPAAAWQSLRAPGTCGDGRSRAPGSRHGRTRVRPPSCTAASSPPL